jgi:uncharacterized membrane protein
MKENLNHPVHKLRRTHGEKLTDSLTKVIGSWRFLIGFMSLIFLWIISNSIWFIFGQTWDPKPFILLNLILSCLATIQAPVILMSQNRQIKRDRLLAEYDYNVNKKAEKEIQEIKEQLKRIEKKLK